jgi:hypothetical protein
MLFQTTLSNAGLQLEERIQEIISQIDTHIKALKLLFSNFDVQKIRQIQTCLMKKLFDFLASMVKAKVSTINIYLKQRLINLIFRWEMKSLVINVFI